MTAKYPPEPGEPDCLCLTCSDERVMRLFCTDISSLFLSRMPFRYGCEICGNKRCPHHSDHRLECTRSNEPGQPGSFLD